MSDAAAQYRGRAARGGRIAPAPQRHIAMNSREARERLIDEVKRHRVLYDTRHEHHRDIEVRDRCWADVAARLGANGEVLKREWKILRDSLRQAVKKSRRGATTKAGAPVKKWRFQARMAFVLPYMTRRSQRQAPSDGGKADPDPDPDGEPGPASDQDEPEPWGAVDAGEGAGAGGEAADDAETDSLELFFAHVCHSARRLPRRQRRQLRRRVLDALLRAEDEAEAERADCKADVF